MESALKNCGGVYERQSITSIEIHGWEVRPCLWTFFIPEHGVAIEIDSSQHRLPEAQVPDQLRTMVLAEK